MAINLRISDSYMTISTPSGRGSMKPSWESSRNQLNSLLNSRSGYRYADRKVGTLGHALSELRSLWGRQRSGSGSSLQAVRVTSSASLNLGAGTASSLASTEEINTTPTSYSTHGPGWSDGSTAEMTVGGVYDGSNGTQTLYFESARSGEYGTDQLKVTLYDQDMQKIEDITISRFATPDTVFTLSNGLTVQFGAGFFTRDDLASIDVFDSVGTSVSTSQPFNGTRLTDPDLQPGTEIINGSFTLNGTSISVYADDSIQTVLDRINASGAGVTAVFDAASESIIFQHGTPGPGTDIELADDSSGFLAAMKLEGAILQQGGDSDLDRIMADVSAFGSVSAGTLLINGAAISLDPASDSLQDLIDRINASPGGVTASISGSGQRLSIVSDEAGQALVLDDGGTGIFAALAMVAGTYEPPEQGTEPTTFSQHQAMRIARVMGDIAEAMNELVISPNDPAQSTGLLSGLRDGIRERIGQVFDKDGPRFRTRYGIQFDFRDSQRQVFTYHVDDRSRFASTIQTNTQSVSNLLFGNGGDDDGLVGGLEALIGETLTEIDDQLGVVGRALDTFA